ncbi:MAG: neutral zinc metallopeptidase, partial [Muribaculaceae bacterium]|nr:neutral zinc metallopeptidase [Muribaculaceae bacterium]
MRLDGRRQSSNVDDRRGQSSLFGGGRGFKFAGGGIGALIIAALITWMAGGDPMSVITQGAGEYLTGDSQVAQNYQPTAQEEEMAVFAKQILAGTEDVWTSKFNNMGMTYTPPKLVLFSGAVQSGCGGATSQTGPFYCSADQTVYLDLDFFNELKSMGIDGDFACAYVIAHEVGHHVQYLLGTLDEAHEDMARLSQTEANKISVRLELQADFYAGVWAYHDNQMFNSLEPGDIEEGLNAASKIGDDYLQKKARGYATPETFNHGRSDQRARWLKLGASTGNIMLGDTFSPRYDA